ncbi:hypothetical protein L198_08069 [Cryptococcus wingfieldii CBS 7118]|uniref:FAD dependent oxidoreductase domain-containing protein n=1 Tax=Cryptococcus wingfieldii CBS 7118 TaxID=1295528 RepID=A0A1E3HJE9_9TREE|nr:hypothetical protein L198_08069 [Cryptococcus wingfieldii CBS 7118]ODN76474.1 hypothetical protein L198_08069 [Cryptococcus wingfieldii CBS 7118]
MSTFPQPFTSTVSHWQATNRGKDSLFGHNKDKALPGDVVDYCVVGAGMAGATTAYRLTRPGVEEGKRVVILEAKDVASGASGRNGGHCAPYSFAALHNYLTPQAQGGVGLDMEEALEALDLERRVLIELREIVEREGWGEKVDFWSGEKVEVRVTPEGAEKMDKLYALWSSARAASRFKDIPLEWSWTHDPATAQATTRMKNAQGFSKGPAGSLHPHKLTTAFLKSALSSPTSNAELYSWAPVQKISKEDGLWVVDCEERGTVKAKNVILCTNAHTPNLFKGSDIDKFLTPFQGQAANVTPPPSYSGSKALDNTYTTDNGTYLINTTHAGIVHGLYQKTSLGKGLMERKDVWGNVDDSVVHPAARKWLAEYCANNFEGWEETAPGEGGMRFWSGIMCATQDTLPLVGQVPKEQVPGGDSQGLYIAAGFHGHGMGRIVLVTKYLVDYIISSKEGEGQWDGGFPKSYVISQERLERGNAVEGYLDEGSNRLD